MYCSYSLFKLASLEEVESTYFLFTVDLELNPASSGLLYCLMMASKLSLLTGSSIGDDGFEGSLTLILSSSEGYC